MSGARRLAKRSIIGTQVCARWHEDGRYYPGIIRSTTEWPNGQEVYNVYLDDLKSTKTYQDNELIGPGFQTINIAVLKNGQKVYVTHNSRESTGTVLSHDRECDDVLITLDLPDGGKTEAIKKLEEIRLLESRRSSRLQHNDTDYSRMNDFQVEPKRRTVSHSIDVPHMKFPRRRRAYSSSSPVRDDDGEMYMDCVSDLSEFEFQTKNESPGGVMDDTMAAMVLTSLSSSPPSLSFPQLPDKFKFKGTVSPAPSSSNGSSGVWGVKSSTSSSPSPPRFRGNPSPPHFLSTSAPVAGEYTRSTATVFGTSPIDEGIDVEDISSFFVDESNSRKRRASTRTVFKCTWPGCKKIHNSCNGIVRHIRETHLGPREKIDSDDSDASDHEEEFYYTEVEVSVDTVTQTFADMHTSSPPAGTAFYDANCGASVSSDHDYQKKSSPMNIPSSRGVMERQRVVLDGSRAALEVSRGGGSLPGSMGTHTSKLSRSFSWQSQQSPAKISKTSPQSGSSRGYSVSVSPKTPSTLLHKKPRSDTKKCRKVYGMENRDLWCTQCKWKKACSRFMD